MDSANTSTKSAEAPDNPIGSKLSAGAIFSIIRRHWILGLAFGLLAGLGLAFFLYQQDPIYEAESSLLVEMSADRVMRMEDVVDSTIETNRLETVMNTHRERLLSKDFAESVLAQFDPATQEKIIAPFQQADPITKETPDASDVLRNSVIELERIPQSQVFYIAAAHPDPETASKIANAYATHYIGYMLGEKASSTERAVSFLQEQADELRKGIRKSEVELQAYRAKHGIIASDKEDDVVSNRLVRINDEMTEERVKIIALRSTLSQVQQANSDRQALLAIQEIFQHGAIPTLVSDLERIRNERDVLSETYLRLHPKMKDNAAEEAATIRALDKNIEKAISSLNRTLANAEQREHTLLGELEQTESKANNLDKLAIEHNVLERKLDTRKSTLDELSARLNETLLAKQLENTNVEVLSLAKTPVIPANPDFKSVAAASFLLFSIVFLGFPLLREYWNGKVKTFAEIEAYIGKPVIGHMRKTRGMRKKTVSQQRKNTELVENFRSLFAQLSLNGGGTAPMSCLVTSTDAGEGKSFVASHLAVTCARHGLHTLLIDADLRRPSIHTHFGMENKLGVVPWFNESGRDDKTQLLGTHKVSGNLHVVSSGGASSRPTEILQSVAFQKLIERLKKDYDTIIIDTPPFGPCPDCQFLARHCDFTLYTVRQNHIPRRKVKAAIQRIDRTSAPVLGVILNQIVGNTADGPYASYVSEYGANYGYGADYYSSAAAVDETDETWADSPGPTSHTTELSEKSKA